MKFTRKFLDGYVTYEEKDSMINANSFIGYIFKAIWLCIWGTMAGIIMFAVLCGIAYLLLGGLLCLFCWIF